MTEPDTADLDILVAQSSPLMCAGEAVDLTPLKVGQLPAFIRAARPILAQLGTGDVIGALLDNPDAALEAIAIASGKPRAWLDALEADDLIRLGARCLEINADFFVRRVLPEIQTASARLTTALDGLPLPSGLSATDTGTAT